MSQTAEQTQVATRIDGELLERLDEFCKTERRPRSFVLATALESFLAERDREPTETGKAAA